MPEATVVDVQNADDKANQPGAMSDPAAPFGGIRQSGLGRKRGSKGILEFCETKYSAVDS